jgi:hypothetical protein
MVGKKRAKPVHIKSEPRLPSAEVDKVRPLPLFSPVTRSLNQNQKAADVPEGSSMCPAEREQWLLILEVVGTENVMDGDTCIVSASVLFGICGVQLERSALEPSVYITRTFQARIDRGTVSLQSPLCMGV